MKTRPTMANLAWCYAPNLFHKTQRCFGFLEIIFAAQSFDFSLLFLRQFSNSPGWTIGCSCTGCFWCSRCVFTNEQWRALPKTYSIATRLVMALVNRIGRLCKKFRAASEASLLQDVQADTRGTKRRACVKRLALICQIFAPRRKVRRSSNPEDLVWPHFGLDCDESVKTSNGFPVSRTQISPTFNAPTLTGTALPTQPAETRLRGVGRSGAAPSAWTFQLLSARQVRKTP